MSGHCKGCGVFQEDAIAWSGWIWAARIYLALRATAHERDHWRDLCMRDAAKQPEGEIER